MTQLAYADDTLVVGRNASTVTLILQTIEEVAAQFNLRLNRGKCELIRIHSSEDVHFYSAEGDPPTAVTVVSKAKYLGMIISEDGNPKRNITERIAKGTAAMKALHRFWRHSSLSLKWKLKVYKMVIIPILTYGLLVESLTDLEFTRLDGAHARFLRRVLHIPTTYYTEVLDPTVPTVTNSEVLTRARIAPLSRYITSYQLKLLGHILRTNNDDLTHDVTFTAGWGRRGFSGAGRRGRKRPRWIDTVPPTAWNRIHEDPDSAPLHLDPHNRPLTTDELPFNPHFHSNPFAFPNFSDQFDFIPLRVVSQHRHFWRECVVRAPTRANSSLFGGSDPHEGECAPGT